MNILIFNNFFEKTPFYHIFRLFEKILASTRFFTNGKKFFSDNLCAKKKQISPTHTSYLWTEEIGGLCVFHHFSSWKTWLWVKIATQKLCRRKLKFLDHFFLLFLRILNLTHQWNEKKSSKRPTLMDLLRIRVLGNFIVEISSVGVSFW